MSSKLTMLLQMRRRQKADEEFIETIQEQLTDAVYSG
jgi:hypothetical protein